MELSHTSSDRRESRTVDKTVLMREHIRQQQQCFHDLVSETWKKNVSGSPFFIWEEKLRRLKVALKNWAKNLPSPIFERKKSQRALGNHQLHMETASITPELLNIEIDLQKALHKALRREEEYW